MGGYGSGRPGWHGKVEQCRSLDINKLRRAGALAPGYGSGWQWTCDGEVVSSISLRASESALHLSYRMSSLPDDQANVSYSVPLTWVECTKGGSRPYFICPMSRNGRYCGRRVGKLYQRGRWFACRHCHQLAYQSQSETRHDRLLRRRNKLSARLSPAGEVDIFPPRPKGMWQSTYEARLQEIWRLEEEADAAFVEWAAQRFPGVRLDSIP